MVQTHPNGPAIPAPLVAAIEAPSSVAAPTVVAVAAALAATAPHRADVVLADLTLDAPHRGLHALDPWDPGLPELATAARFGPPPTPEVDAALHPAPAGYQVLPGLRRHRDWVSIRPRSASAAVDALRAHAAGPVIAHVERDLEGELDTGSFDIEDRNALARAAVAAADLVVTVATADRAGRLGLTELLGSLGTYGVSPQRILVLVTGARWSVTGARTAIAIGPHVGTGTTVLSVGRRRADVRLGSAIRARLAAVAGLGSGPGPPAATPRRIEPGSLGRWDQGVDGWITPSVPQQP